MSAGRQNILERPAKAQRNFGLHMKANFSTHLCRWLMSLAGIGITLAGVEAYGWPHACYSGGYEPAARSAAFCRPDGFSGYRHHHYSSYGQASPYFGGRGAYHSYPGSYSSPGYHSPAFGPSYGYGGSYGQGYSVYGTGAIYPYATFRDDPYYSQPTVHIFHLPDYGDDPEGWERNSAWNKFTSGDPVRAAEIFAAAERQFPGRAWPKIGAGLIAGLNGNHSKVQYNFQRGFRFDTQGPGPLPENPELMEKVKKLTDHYRTLVRTSRKKADAEFMLAALSYLTADYAAGRDAINKAIAHGDDSRSARNLKNLLDHPPETSLAQVDSSEDGGTVGR